MKKYTNLGNTISHHDVSSGYANNAPYTWQKWFNLNYLLVKSIYLIISLRRNCSSFFKCDWHNFKNLPLRSFLEKSEKILLSVISYTHFLTMTKSPVGYLVMLWSRRLLCLIMAVGILNFLRIIHCYNVSFHFLSFRI